MLCHVITSYLDISNHTKGASFQSRITTSHLGICLTIFSRFLRTLNLFRAFDSIPNTLPTQFRLYNSTLLDSIPHTRKLFLQGTADIMHYAATVGSLGSSNALLYTIDVVKYAINDCLDLRFGWHVSTLLLASRSLLIPITEIAHPPPNGCFSLSGFIDLILEVSEMLAGTHQDTLKDEGSIFSISIRPWRNFRKNCTS